MSDEGKNGIATGEDFRKLAEMHAWGPAERVTLPHCGLAVILRRPTKFYWALRRANWKEALREKLDTLAAWRDGLPEEMAAKLTAIYQGEEPSLSPEEVACLGVPVTLDPAEQRTMFLEDAEVIREAFVEPKISPQFDPGWIPDDDKRFILAYLKGQVFADGKNLERFPGGEHSAIEGGGATRAAV